MPCSSCRSGLHAKQAASAKRFTLSRAASDGIGDNITTAYQANIGAFREDALSEQDAKETCATDSAATDAMMADLLGSLKVLLMKPDAAK